MNEMRVELPVRTVATSSRYSSEKPPIYGIVYTSKGLASIFAGPVAALASVRTGNWIGVFWVMIACDLTAAILALAWLKPVAGRTIARPQEMALADQTSGTLVTSRSGS